MRFKEYLAEQALILEDRIAFLKDKFKGISTEHDTLAQHHDSDAIVDHFAQHADPTTNKAHTQWIMGQYKAGAIRQEDHPRIHAALTNFKVHGKKLEKRDINQYKSLSELEDAVEPHLGTASSNREEKRITKHEGADLIHDDNGVTVHQIKTKEAAKLYGKGTKWCTAGEHHNMYDYYAKNGPLHVIQHEGRKYQFHVESGQFMDEKDNPVQPHQLHPDIWHSLGKSLHPEIAAFNVEFNNHHASKETLEAASNSTSTSIRGKVARHHNATPELIDKALRDRHPHVRSAATYSRNLTDGHIEKLLSDNQRGVKISAAQNIMRLTPTHLDKLLSSEDADVREAASRHPNLNKQNLDRAVADSDYRVQMNVATHPHATADHLDAAMSNHRYQVRSAVMRNPNSTADHVAKGLDDASRNVRELAMHHPSVNADHLTHVLKHEQDSDLRELAVSHNKATVDHVTMAMKDPAIHVRHTALNSPHITPEHVRQALNDPEPHIRERAFEASNHHRTHEEISKGMRDPEHWVRAAAVEHPDASEEHIRAALMDSSSTVRMRASKHRKCTSEMIQTAKAARGPGPHPGLH